MNNTKFTAGNENSEFGLIDIPNDVKKGIHIPKEISRIILSFLGQEFFIELYKNNQYSFLGHLLPRGVFNIITFERSLYCHIIHVHFKKSRFKKLKNYEKFGLEGLANDTRRVPYHPYYYMRPSVVSGETPESQKIGHVRK